MLPALTRLFPLPVCHLSLSPPICHCHLLLLCYQPFVISYHHHVVAVIPILASILSWLVVLYLGLIHRRLPDPFPHGWQRSRPALPQSSENARCLEFVQIRNISKSLGISRDLISCPNIAKWKETATRKKCTTTLLVLKG